MRFRPSDRLDELTATANQALENIEQSFAQIQDQTHTLQAALLKIEQDGSSGVKEARDAMDNMATVLQRFDFRSLNETRVRI
jgi:hypothetical protein